MKRTYRFLGVIAALIMAANANATGQKQANCGAVYPEMEISALSMMQTNSTFSTLQRIIADHFGKPISIITLEARFKEDLGADSLDMFELIMECEKEFGIEISVSAVEKFNTVEDLYKYIVKRID